MATYIVTDPSTGTKLKFSGNTPPTEDVLKQAFSQEGGQSQQGAFTGALQKTGLYDVPVLGGLLGRGMAQPLARGAETVAEGVASPIMDLLSKGQVTNQNRFMAPQDFQQVQSSPAEATKYGAGVGLQAGLAALGAKSLPQVPAAAAKVPGLLGFLTKAGVGQKIGNKVAQATAEGVTDTAGDVATEIKQAVGNKLGNLQPYTDIANNRISSIQPASIDANPTLTPKDLLNLRQQAANRIPNGIFAKFQGKSPSDQVDEIVRQVASSRLKDLAGTKNLDKLYSVYSKFGSPAEIASRAAIGGIASSVVPDQYKQQVGGGLAGALELAKILGLF